MDLPKAACWAEWKVGQKVVCLVGMKADLTAVGKAASLVVIKVECWAAAWAVEKD